MGGMYFLMPTLLVIFISFLVVRAAAIALMMTGMDEKRARFQAISAFTGTGFTTREAEYVVNNPRRRQIVSWLMILGNAGIVTLIVTATSSFVSTQGHSFIFNFLVLVLGGFLIYRVATNRGFIRRWETFIEDKLARSKGVEEGITEDLLHLLEGYGLLRLIITESSSLVGSSLLEHRLTEKGLLVLGIERDKKWMPIPKAKEVIKEGDRVVVYGPIDVIRSVFKSEPKKNDEKLMEDI